MAKNLFVCQSCGAEHRKWAGQCSDCHAWNCIAEQVIEVSPRTGELGKAIKPSAITDISIAPCPRRHTNITELDRVLGGGIVAGSAILIGGSPGIGKSTLLLQAAAKLAGQGTVLYITGEESIQQVRMRGERIKSLHPQLQLIAACELESSLASIQAIQPIAVIIDSIQTAYSSRLSSAPGTVSQVRDCASALIQNCKQQGHVLILVGHVTKDGGIAGPRVLEHMVDTVLYFEGDQGHSHRIIRAVKNRFGPAGEIGVFEMCDTGLIGIKNASRLFLADRNVGISGSVILACMEGTRPFLVEVQALVAPTTYASPKRSSVGLDINRIAMLTAVLERRLGIPLSGYDVYVNVAGGARITEPAADLAVLLAILSAYQDKALPTHMAVFGEVGLTGEIRPVSTPENRAREAANLGFSQLIMPHENHTRVQDSNLTVTLRDTGMELSLIPVKHLSGAAQMALE
ncbi:MAG: DNA repair protein RadA [Mariprofundaceae bacterium]